MKLFSAQKQRLFSPLILFSLVVFLVSLHDGIISYISPVLVNNKFHDTFLVGLILSISPVFGVLFDFAVSKFFPKKSYKFFLFWMLIFAFIVSLLLISLKNTLATFIVVMITWSVYYQFRNYSKYDFVNRFVHIRDNTEAWSTLTTFQSTAYLIGPILTIYLLNSGKNVPLYASLFVLSTALLIYFSSVQNLGKRHKQHNDNPDAREFLKGLKVIHILAKRIWPLVLFSFALTLLDVSFWTTGVLYSERLKVTSGVIGGLIITIYCLPSLFTGLITTKIFDRLGKKKTSFVSGILAGLGLVVIGFSKNIFLTLGAVLFTATCADISFVLIFATFQDYVTRLDEGGTDLVGINQINQNLAYFLGPIILGLVSRNGHLQNSFLLTGGILILSSIAAFMVVPRKIKMPQKILRMILGKKMEEDAIPQNVYK